MKWKNFAMLILAYVTILGVLVACASWTPEQKVVACQAALDIVAKPECLRLNDVDPRYVVHCETAVDLAREACVLADRAGKFDASQICGPIEVLADQCDRVVPGDDPRNVATCERVIRSGAAYCKIRFAKPAPAEAPAEAS